MAFSGGTIWHIKSTGATTNGGGFNPENANFATDGTVDTNTGNTGSPVFSSASYNFVAGDVGHWLFIQSGTNCTPGWYQIASVASNKATLSAAVGAGVLYGTSQTGKNYHRPNGLNTAAGIATVGTPSSIVWGIDYSQSTGAGITFTDLVIDGTTNTDFTSAGNPIDVNMIGNIFNVTSGTGFTVQRVELVSIPSGVIGRADKSLGTLSSTGGNAKLGGSASTIATILNLSLVAGNHVYIWDTATYTLTSTVTVTASAKGSISAGHIVVEGCHAYMGDRGGRPVITSATNSVALFTLNDNDYWEFVHLNPTHTAATRGRFINWSTSASSPVVCEDIICDGCLDFDNASSVGGELTLIDCEVKNCTNTTAAVNCGNGVSLNLYGCEIHNNAGPGIGSLTTSTVTINVQNSIIDNNTVGIGILTTNNNVTLQIHNTVICDNSDSGIEIEATSGNVIFEIVDNIIYSNGGYGIENKDEQMNANANQRIIRANAFGDNNGGGTGLDRLGVQTGYDDITLSADPFTNKASRDFSINSTAGGGALLRNAQFPTTFPSGIVSRGTVGAVQPQGATGHVIGA